MSKDGLKCWTPHLRHTLKKEVNIPVGKYYFDGHAALVPIEYLNNEATIAEYVDLALPDGTYYAQGFTARRTPTRRGFTKKLFDVTKHTDNEGNVYVDVEPKKRLTHYFCWKGRLEKYLARFMNE